MLFNSYQFIFLFLPLTLLIFHTIGRRNYHKVAIAWLVGASLFFYGWWNPAYLGLILFSIIFNYGVGVILSGNDKNKPILIFGVVINLVLLGYYKYVNFFVNTANNIFDSNIIFNTVILPLAISFFTFQQIAYLVDAYRGEVKEYNFLHYCLFVTFFPQLIAGPIVHHKEMMPQFARDIVYRIGAKNLAIGITIFAIGLFKKVVIADGISVYATPVFDAAEAGMVLTFFEAWAGVIAYTFQLYFDFSGYSDMAIGIARMFGIKLPINFNSPYKALSIIEFWKRWHITLSRFLRDYLYIPLGGNRKGRVRRLINVMITMLLGGLWHGAGWTFVLWGGLHGIYIVINYAWNIKYNLNSRILAWSITMFFVIVAWVPFRSNSIEGALNMYASMAGIHGLSLPVSLDQRLGLVGEWLEKGGVVFHGAFVNGVFGDHFTGVAWIFILGLMVTLSCNTQEMINFLDSKRKNSIGCQYHWLEWHPTRLWSVFISILLIFSILNLSGASEFLYFQF
ncbi:MBOAT family protein [bacterium]|jgi:D-alanyl-lipoteichoic acid acyltransferase DltB (MBOAT superfamily)|nr:MBOAT family protein [bacterium]